jgi:DNA (cytosine-5)-methyltransferase 1
MTHDNNHQTPYSFIDLFAGAGGFSLGFSQEGFRDLLAIEKDVEPAETYKLNFPKSDVWVRDINEIHSLEILNKSKKAPDVILASPPCEPFTSANPKRLETAWSRFYEDPQGDLIFQAIRLIGDLEPKMFIIENVVPILNQDGKEIIRSEFEKTGYDKIYFNIIDAEKHGCPSSRKRVFISNTHLQLSFRQQKTIEESLQNLPSPSEPHDIPNHSLVNFPEQVEKKLHRIKKGHAAVFFRGAQLEQQNWLRLDEKTVAPTIMGKSRFIHFDGQRAITPREQARLMSYPDTFEFQGSITSIYNQIGESVPPIISQQIAKKVKEKMD